MCCREKSVGGVHCDKTKRMKQKRVAAIMAEKVKGMYRVFFPFVFSLLYILWLRFDVEVEMMKSSG